MSLLRAPLGDVSNLQNSGKTFGEKRQRPERRQGKAPVAKPRTSNGKDRRKEGRYRDMPGECMSIMMPPCQYEYEYSYDCYPMMDDMGGMMGMQQGMLQPMVPQMQPGIVQPMPSSMPMQPSLAPMQRSQPNMVWFEPPVRREPMKERRREEPADTFVYPGHPQYAPIDVTVKNTFIDLPAPRTPSPSGRFQASTPPVASTCPPKCLMGEQLRQERESARAEANEARQLFAGKDKDVKPVESEASVGSLLHRAGLCKPCAWVHHAKGCQRGATCEFCHTCPPGEIKKRKKEKTVLIRKRRTQYQPACTEYKAVPQFEFSGCSVW